MRKAVVLTGLLFLVFVFGFLSIANPSLFVNSRREVRVLKRKIPSLREVVKENEETLMATLSIYENLEIEAASLGYERVSFKISYPKNESNAEIKLSFSDGSKIVKQDSLRHTSLLSEADKEIVSELVSAMQEFGLRTIRSNEYDLEPEGWTYFTLHYFETEQEAEGYRGYIAAVLQHKEELIPGWYVTIEDFPIA